MDQRLSGDSGSGRIFYQFPFQPQEDTSQLGVGGAAAFEAANRMADRKKKRVTSRQATNQSGTPLLTAVFPCPRIRQP